MNVDAQAGCAGSNTPRAAEALYFDSDDRKLFGWLHSVSAKTPRIGLVICKPFGYEAMCSHRGTRAFAEAAAALGVPTLRFDYSGTGDSADSDPLADQLATWTRDVVAAVAELRRLSGVERVCLLGFRLGALIATLAAGECNGAVDALALVAPVFNGRRYIRELRTTRLAAMMGAEQEPVVPVDNQAAASGSMEVSGYLLSAATLAALSGIDLTKLERRPASDMLIIDGSSLAVSRGWVDALTRLGTRTEYQALPGLVQMLMTAPQFAKIPQEMIQATGEWLTRQLPGPVGGPILAPERQPPKGAAGQLTLPGEPSAPHASLSERPVFFGSEAVLFGIVTEPHQREKRRRAVLLLNAGADSHIGASRMYVELARRWARSGYVVLRMDLAGLGDSGTRPGRFDDEVFPPAAMQDIRAAIDHLRGHYGVRDTTIAGLCSGAYHALRAAAAEIPVNRILMINPQNYFWKEGQSVTDVQVAELVRNPGLYRSRVFSLGAWKKLFTGRLNIAYISTILGHRLLLGFESTMRDLARRLRLHLPHDLGWELERIAARGVRVVFVFARGEPGIELLRIQAGSSVKRVGDRCRVHILDNGDHVFSKSGTRVILEGVLDSELFGRNPWEGAPSSL
jgi:alpha-beta hydrolase superfamily lysophospholipase